MPIVPKEELLGFIARAHRNTYAAPKEVRVQHRCAVPLLPGHKDYSYTEKVWRYHDSYAGSLLAPGREVVFISNEPVWGMSYQGGGIDVPGYSNEFFEEEAFPFLRKALMAFEDHKPFRGRDGFKEGNFLYLFNFTGDYRYFVGKESILHRGTEVFRQDVMGSLII